MSRTFTALLAMGLWIALVSSAVAGPVTTTTTTAAPTTTTAAPTTTTTLAGRFTICHKGKTITVDAAGRAEHLANHSGDTDGACLTPP